MKIEIINGSDMPNLVHMCQYCALSMLHQSTLKTRQVRSPTIGASTKASIDP